MIGALLALRCGAIETTVTRHLKGHREGQGTPITPIGIGPRDSVLDCSELSGRHRFEQMAGVIGTPRGALCRDVPDLSRRSAHADVDLCTIRLAASITPALPRHVKGAFYRSLNRVDMLRDARVRELSHANGGYP